MAVIRHNKTGMYLIPRFMPHRGRPELAAGKEAFQYSDARHRPLGLATCMAKIRFSRRLRRCTSTALPMACCVDEWQRPLLPDSIEPYSCMCRQCEVLRTHVGPHQCFRRDGRVPKCPVKKLPQGARPKEQHSTPVQPGAFKHNDVSTVDLGFLSRKTLTSKEAPGFRGSDDREGDGIGGSNNMKYDGAS